MGEIAEGLINGDFDEETGEYIGRGQGFPRSLQREQREQKSFETLNSTMLVIQKLLVDNGYLITQVRGIAYGSQIRTASGAIVNIYTSGKVCLQGKPDEKLKQLIK